MSVRRASVPTLSARNQRQQPRESRHAAHKQEESRGEGPSIHVRPLVCSRDTLLCVRAWRVGVWDISVAGWPFTNLLDTVYVRSIVARITRDKSTSVAPFGTSARAAPSLRRLMYRGPALFPGRRRVNNSDAR